MAMRLPSPTQNAINGYIKELDGLRGVAIVLVLIHHFWPSTGYWSRFEDVARLGWIGVDLFFVISGFLITGILLETAGKDGYYRNFYARRALRIFPLYYLFLAFVYTTIPFFQDGNYWQTSLVTGSGSPLWYICYLGNVREALLGKSPAYYLAPLWSLAIEEQFYLSFPLLVASLSRRGLATVLWMIVFFAPIFRFATIRLYPPNDLIQYVSTFSRADEIALGCLLAVWFRSSQEMLPRASATAFVLLMLAVLSVTFHFSWLDRALPFCRSAGYSLTGFAAFAVVLWVMQNRGSLATGVFRFRPLCFVGMICYGIYLLHRPAETCLSVVLWLFNIDCDPGSLYLLGAKFAAAVLLATASWYVVEKPFLRLKHLFTPKDRSSTEPLLPPLTCKPVC